MAEPRRRCQTGRASAAGAGGYAPEMSEAEPPGGTRSLARATAGGALLLWGLGSAAAIVAGSLGPWATAGPFSAAGTDAGHDGTITLALGAAALLPVAIGRLRPLVGVLAVLALSVGLYDTLDVHGRATALYPGAVGWGLVVVDLAAASLLAWTLLGRR